MFDHAYVHGVNDDTVFGYFDDSHGFADVLAKLRTGSFMKLARQGFCNDVGLAGAQCPK